MKLLAGSCSAVLLIFGLTTVASGSEPYSRAIDRVVPLQGATVLAVRASTADIALIADGGNTVRVHLLVRSGNQSSLGAVALLTSVEGNRVIVRDRCSSTSHFLFWSWSHCNDTLEIRYPRSMAVTARLSTGDFSVANPDGPLDVRNGTGNVNIVNASRSVRAKTSIGDLDVGLSNGWHGRAIDLSTGTGDADLRVPANFRAALSAHTSVGDVENDAHLSGGPVRVRARTSVGDVVITRE